MSQAIHFINGSWTAGTGHPVSSIDPAKNQVIWDGLSASAEQVEQSVAAARDAFTSWSAKSVEERLEVIKRFGELLTENKGQLGKSYRQGNR